MAIPALNSEEEKQAALDYIKRMEEYAKGQTAVPPVPQPNPVEVALVPTEPLVPPEQVIQAELVPPFEPVIPPK